MVLTDEQKPDIYPAATLEDSKIATEENYFSITSGQVVDKSQAIGIPDYANNNVIPNPPPNPVFDNANSAKLYVLNKNSQQTGLGITLKVMSGDTLDIYGKSYYFQNNTGGSSANSTVPILDILTGFLGAASGAITGVHGGVTPAQLNEITATTVPINSLLNNQTDNNDLTPQKPKAFINYILFDEQFKGVGSGFAPVGDNAVLADYASTVALHNIPVDKSGYVYIYCSNESPVDVFFDNLQVVQTKGAILEETHYYPFGLTMAGISSKAYGGVENKFGITSKEKQNKEFNDGSGIELYDFGARMQDPQLGRWHVIDPLVSNYYWLSPYNYCNNNPIKYLDPNGMKFRKAVIDGKEGRYDVETLDNITIMGKSKKPSSLISYRTQMADHWILKKDLYGQARYDGWSQSQMFDVWSKQGVKKSDLEIYEKRYQRMMNFRNVQLVAVGVMGAPVVATAVSPAIFVGTTYARIGVAGADISVQYALNIGKGYGFLGENISNINITSVLANGAMPGSAIGASIIGNGFDLRINGYAGVSSTANGAILSTNILLGWSGNKIGGGLSNTFGSYMKAGPILNNYTGNIFGDYIGYGGQNIIELSNK